MWKLGSRDEALHSSTMETCAEGGTQHVKTELADAGPLLSASLNSFVDWNVNGLGDMCSESEDMQALFPCSALDADLLGDTGLFDSKTDFNFGDLSLGTTAATSPRLVPDQKDDLGYCGGDSLMTDLSELMDKDVSPSCAALCPQQTGLDYGDIIYEDMTRSVDDDQVMHASCKDEEMSSMLDAVSPSSLLLPKSDGVPLSPPYASSESWDSGVSAGEASPPGTNSEQRLSPERECGWSVSCSPSSQYSESTLSPPSLSSPQLSPSSLSSPQLSPSSSPTSSPHINAAPATRNLIVGVTSSSPHFITEKRPKYTFTTSANKANINSTTRCSNVNNCKPLTVLTTTTTTSSRVPLNTSRNTPTIINRSQPINKVADNASCTKSNGRVLQKSSPSPSVVTLSGVNKTAGIIKSPSVISVSRKHTMGTVNNGSGITSNGTVINSGAVIGTIEQQQQQQAPKPIAVISPSGEVVASTSGGSQVFKTVTVSSTNGRFTTANGQQVIFAPRGIVSSLPTGRIVRSGQNILVPFDPKSMEKLRTIKIVSSKSGSLTATPGVRTLSSMGAGTTTATILRSTTSTPASTASHSFVSSRARTIGITGVPPTSRPATVSILKNVCVPLETKAGDGSYASLVSLPKQESLDSDEEIEFPKKNEPLILTEEEQKLVLKENVKLPSHFPLTKRQERDLKRIKRKIRNKISAQDSRKRKKEYMDKLEETIQERTRENDRLKLQMATLEETNKQLTEQLQKFQDMMNASHAAPTLTSSTSHHHHHNTRQQQQHPSAFLLMMILSAALFIYPSVLPQGKGGSDLLTTMPHKMPPAGNSRSLLEAATARLSVCQEGDDFDEELKLENKLVDSSKMKALHVLSDHDYAPPLKRGRYDPRDDNFCTAGPDERITPPRKKQRLTDSCVSSPPVEDVVEIKDEALSPPPALDHLAQISKKAEDEAAVREVISAPELASPASKGAELGSPASKGPVELLAALGGGASDYWEKLRAVAMSALLGSLAKPHNRTVEPSGAALHEVASQLVVELKSKGFREDLELE